jgi:hypothetical protein
MRVGYQSKAKVVFDAESLSIPYASMSSQINMKVKNSNEYQLHAPAGLAPFMTSGLLLEVGKLPHLTQSNTSLGERILELQNLDLKLVSILHLKSKDYDVPAAPSA